MIFNTKITAPSIIRECIIVRVTDKGDIEFIKEDNYVTVFLIVGRNTEIVPHNQYFQVNIVEVNLLQSGHLNNISSAPNQNIFIRISSQITQTEEEASGRGGGWRGFVGEVG